MNDAHPLNLSDVTDEDIRRACHILRLPDDAFHGHDGADPRHLVLKCLETMDIAACPGSGKTTLLVAKLAILSEKWQHYTRGICVLSHTNAARSEIETRLGNTTVGRSLLSYPHYIGTIHGFVDEFLAIPWLRSRGYPVCTVNTDLCMDWRLKSLPVGIRKVVENRRDSNRVLSVKSPDFGVGAVRSGKGLLGTATPMYTAFREVCRKSAERGFFCYDEMFMWANDLLDKFPSVALMVRGRFPIVFIDEAQDNSDEQSAILHRVFTHGDEPAIRQRFGDGNQAIFDHLDAKQSQTDSFPDERVKKDLPSSHRFGQKITRRCRSTWAGSLWTGGLGAKRGV